MGWDWISLTSLTTRSPTVIINAACFVSPIDPSVQMGVVQLGVVQLGVVQLGIVQMGVDLATDITTIWGELLEQTSCCVLKIEDSIN